MKTDNLDLEVGGLTADGGQEGAMKRNFQKIDAAFAGMGTGNAIVDLAYDTGVLTATRADGTTFDLTIPAA